jgi:hypothetical protein
MSHLGHLQTLARSCAKPSERQEQPCHGARYYVLLAALVAAAGLFYLAWSGFHIV